MVVHRVEIYHSVAGAQSFHNWLSTWLTNMEPWADDEVDNELPTISEEDGEEYYYTELAFEWTEDRAHILDNLDQYAEAYCDWHQIPYHECRSDEDDHACGYDEVRRSETLPEYIPPITAQS